MNLIRIGNQIINLDQVTDIALSYHRPGPVYRKGPDGKIVEAPTEAVRFFFAVAIDDGDDRMEASYLDISDPGQMEAIRRFFGYGTMETAQVPVAAIC